MGKKSSLISRRYVSRLRNVGLMDENKMVIAGNGLKWMRELPQNLSVAKVVGLQSPLHEQGNLENAVYTIVCC